MLPPITQEISIEPLEVSAPLTFSSDIPSNGPLSGMIITAFTALIVVALSLTHESFRNLFSAPLSARLLQFFFFSIGMMTLHKIESFWFQEYDQCPVYLTSGLAPWAKNPRKAIFLSFVTAFIGMLFVVYLALLGPPWHLILITVWLAQGLHELHHAAKSLARRKIYPGLFTSLCFVMIQSLGIFPLWHDQIFRERGSFFFGYYALLPLVFLAFFLEDFHWTSRTPKTVWQPI